MERTERGGAPLRRPFAVILAAVLAGHSTPALLIAAGPIHTARIRGSVVREDGLTAVAGASVMAAHLQTGTIYASDPTSAEGGYVIAGLPAGSYDLAVRMPEGLYAADLQVETQAGDTSLVSLALKPSTSADPQEDKPQEGEGEEAKPEEPKPPEEEPKAEEGKKPEGEDQGQAEPKQKEKKRRRGEGFWRSTWGAVASIVVGSALVGVGANSVADDDADEEDTQSMSASAPRGSSQ